MLGQQPLATRCSRQNFSPRPAPSHHSPTPDEGFELYWEEMHNKHAQACTDALVASHHQPRNLTLLEPISALGNFRRNLTPRMRGSKTHQKGRETQVTSSLGRSLELSYLFDKFECPSLRASNGMDLQHSVRKQSHVLGCGLWHEKPTCGLLWPDVSSKPHLSWPHTHVFLAKNRIQIRGLLGFSSL